jgi:hypothetical protein
MAYLDEIYPFFSILFSWKINDFPLIIPIFAEGTNGGKAPPPYQQFRQNGNATNMANGNSVHGSVLAAPFPLPRSNTSTASVAGSDIGGGGGNGQQRRQFPAILPPMIVGNNKSGAGSWPKKFIKNIS